VAGTDNPSTDHPTIDEQVKQRQEHDLKVPDLYRVLLHNDHYTTMEFVVEVLVKVFHKSVLDATEIMLNVHERGAGQAGQYTYDIAQTKVAVVHRMAKQREYPLRCTIEKV